jgi:hypothetical protein
VFLNTLLKRKKREINLLKIYLLRDGNALHVKTSIEGR